MLNLLEPAEFKRLVGAIDWSEKKLQEFRADFKDVLREFAGFHYGEDAAPDARPINQIQFGATVYHRKLCVSDLQALVSTRYRELLSSAEDFKLGLNHALQAAKVEKSLNESALHALFAIGVVVVGIDQDTLDVFVEPVLFEDLILDLSATSWRQLGFIGHRYRMPVDWVKKNEAFDPEIRARAAENNWGGSSSAGGNRSEVSAQAMSVGVGYVESYKAMTELVDVFLPQERLMVTYLAGSPSTPLSVVEWEGPEFSPFGPFRILSFVDVPGNIMPVGPVQFWRDVHDIINILANKTFRQAERQKDVTLVPNNLDADGKRIVEASDGDGIGVTETDKVIQRSFGGANQVNLGMVMWLKNLFNYVSGGANMLSGAEASTDTVGQDQMLLQSAGTQIESMQKRMMQFVREVVTDVAWWLWTDTTGYIDLSRPIPGSQRSVTYRWDFRRKKGDFFQFNFDIEPYSIARRSPQQRLQNLLQMWQGILMPMQPGMQAQGMGLDYEYIIKLAAEYSGEPEFAHAITYASGEQHPGAGPRQPSEGGGLNKPNGRYVRENKSPGKTFENEFMAKMLDGGRQQQQAMK